MADPLNFQIPREGYDSYLYGIIPDDQAVLAGAFSVTMQQVRNIQKGDIQKFAQVAYNIENMAGLPFTAGTDIPTDLQSATFAKSQTALGSGVYGTYVMSNFFGCMSGLPYPLKQIYDSIKQLQTQTLASIYQNLYLLVVWEQATAISYLDGGGNVIVEVTNGGGGYSSAPTVTVNGNSATATIGTDPEDLSTFGKLISIQYSGSTAGAVSISAPAGPNPITDNAAYNSQLVSYCNQANDEILAIRTSSAENFQAANLLDVYWNITGTALKQEQRARYDFFAPVPIPYDRWLNISPTALYVFVDSIPDLAQKTLPHQAAQTLEHISNLKSIGGESVVGMMRQERNQARLAEIGIELDNNIPSGLSPEQEKMLLTNGTLPGAVDGIPSPAGVDYTLPAWPALELPTGGTPCNNDVTTEVVTPEPVAIYDVNTQTLREIQGTTEGTILPILTNTVLGPFSNGTGPPILIDGELPPGLGTPRAFCGPDSIFIPLPEIEEIPPTIDVNGEIPNIITNPVVPVGDTPPLDPPDDNPLGINMQPPVDDIPPNLNTAYTGTTLLPSTYDVPNAIDKVIECNCDCWIG